MLHRLRRAEGQIRAVQRMIEEGEDCLKVSQQFMAVRKALDSTYLRMTMCLMEQEFGTCISEDPAERERMRSWLKDMESLLAGVG
ncbi:hypothetical protein Cenrod_0554 [Candidatus Symbiobacter mobilis CR]|uniref:Transcriptional regulator n=1 Tax=Candidatus Symbiobacter mobilis CR TaxID=946483 RepID=U5N5N4_9BURK|nr:hypothetical protein Cenrod_0554 [Candidatus Symbiobacter mobilis CR]